MTPGRLEELAAAGRLQEAILPVGPLLHLPELRLDAEGKRAAADAGHLHRIVVVARHRRPRQEFQHARLQIRRPVGETDHDAAPAGGGAHVLDELLQRIRARAAELVALTPGVGIAHGGKQRARHVPDVYGAEPGLWTGYEQNRQETRELGELVEEAVFRAEYH